MVIVLGIKQNSLFSYASCKMVSYGELLGSQPISIAVQPISAGHFPLMYDFIVEESGNACKSMGSECEKYLMGGL